MYVTVDEIKALNIKKISNLSEEKLEYYIKIISKEIDEYCNTVFEPTKESDKLDYKKLIYVKKRPLIKIEEIIINEKNLQENKHFFVYPEKSKVEFIDMKIKNPKRAVTLYYIYGFENVPATVKSVIVDLLKLTEESNSYSNTGIQSENWDGEYSYSMHSSKDFLPTELRKNILQRLDIFKQNSYEESENYRVVKAMLL